MIRCTHYSMPAGGQTTEHKGKIRADGQYIRGNRLSIWDDEYYTHLNTKGLMIPEKILNLNELVVLKSYSGLHVSTSNPPDGLYLRTYHASSTIISRSPTPVPFLSWGPYLSISSAALQAQCPEMGQISHLILAEGAISENWPLLWLTLLHEALQWFEQILGKKQCFPTTINKQPTELLAYKLWPSQSHSTPQKVFLGFILWQYPL